MNCPPNTGVFDSLHRHLSRIVLQYGEISFLTDLNGPNFIIHMQRVGRPNGNRLERLSYFDLLSLPCVRPDAVMRFTAAHAVNKGPNGVTGASE